MKEEDVLKSLAAGPLLGGTNLDFQIDQYVWKMKIYGIYIISLKKIGFFKLVGLYMQHIHINYKKYFNKASDPCPALCHSPGQPPVPT